MRRDVFQAIADPTRRDIIELLSKRSMNLNQVADEFTVSRPAISKHIKILYQCGLIEIRRSGRERICEAKLESLENVANWAEKYRAFWMRKLDHLDEFLQDELKKEKPKRK